MNASELSSWTRQERRLYLESLKEFPIGRLQRIYNEISGQWELWTIRLKYWDDEKQQYSYFLTRPGRERWFDFLFLHEQTLRCWDEVYVQDWYR